MNRKIAYLGILAAVVLVLFGINYLSIYNPTLFYNETDYFRWFREQGMYDIYLYSSIACFLAAGILLFLSILALRQTVVN